MAFLKFPISDELNRRIHTYIQEIRDPDVDPNEYKMELAWIVEASISSGIDYFLIHSLDVVGVNALSRRGIVVVVRSAERAFATATRTLVRTLTPTQIRATADFLEDAL